jgi:hypothetical protein
MKLCSFKIGKAGRVGVLMKVMLRYLKARGTPRRSRWRM